MTDPLYILAVLALAVALSEMLVRRTVLRHLGTALLVILVTAVAVNLRIIPPVSAQQPVPLYDALLGPVAKVAIFWLLLRVHLGQLRQAGGTMIAVFLIGSLGTFAGVLAAFQVVGGGEAFAPNGAGLAAMFVGTYTGGSVNFNAMAEEYEILRQGDFYVAAAVVDSAMTTVWMALSIVLPRLLGSRGGAQRDAAASEAAASDDDVESLHPSDVAWLLALGAGGVWLSERIADSVPVPSILILTTIALIAAHIPVVRRLRGTRTLGMFAVYLFLAGIGALCDLSALRAVGSLGTTLFVFASIALLVHSLFVVVAARLLSVGPEVAAVASQANVGGSTSALALARSLGRADLVLPAILVGALGNALGNYLGVLAAAILGPGSS